MVILPNPEHELKHYLYKPLVEEIAFCCQLYECGGFETHLTRKEKENSVLYTIKSLLEEGKVGYAVLRRDLQADWIDLFLSAGVVKTAIEFEGPETGSPLIFLFLDPSLWEME